MREMKTSKREVWKKGAPNGKGGNFVTGGHWCKEFNPKSKRPGTEKVLGSVTADALLSDLGITTPLAHQRLLADAAASRDTGWQRALENLIATIQHGAGASVGIEISDDRIAKDLTDTLNGVVKEPRPRLDLDKLKAAQMDPKSPIYKGGQKEIPADYSKLDPPTWEEMPSYMQFIRGMDNPNAKRSTVRFQ